MVTNIYCSSRNQSHVPSSHVRQSQLLVTLVPEHLNFLHIVHTQMYSHVTKNKENLKKEGSLTQKTGVHMTREWAQPSGRAFAKHCKVALAIIPSATRTGQTAKSKERRTERRRLSSLGS